MNILDLEIVVLILWIDLIVDAWFFGWIIGRRDLKFYLLSLVLPPAGIVVAIDTVLQRPARSRSAVGDGRDGGAMAPADPGLVGPPVEDAAWVDDRAMVPVMVDDRDLVPVMVEPSALDAHGAPLPKHAWWLPDRGTVPVEDIRVTDGDLCRRCGLHIDADSPGRCRHCGALSAERQPVSAS